MSDDTPSPAGRALITGLLAFATLGFGLAGLCGAAFTVTALPDMWSTRVENYSAAVLVIAVPSLLIGGGLAWVFGRKLGRRFRDDA
jgi:hypothetical protein